VAYSPAANWTLPARRQGEENLAHPFLGLPCADQAAENEQRSGDDQGHDPARIDRHRQTDRGERQASHDQADPREGEAPYQQAPGLLGRSVRWRPSGLAGLAAIDGALSNCGSLALGLRHGFSPRPALSVGTELSGRASPREWTERIPPSAGCRYHRPRGHVVWPLGASSRPGLRTTQQRLRLPSHGVAAG